jgi:hypothetical protein
VICNYRGYEFITIAPGGILYLSHGKNFFQSGSETAQRKSRNIKSVDKGAHVITATFSNSDDGQRFGLTDIWTGELTSTVTFIVK